MDKAMWPMKTQDVWLSIPHQNHNTARAYELWRHKHGNFFKFSRVRLDFGEINFILTFFWDTKEAPQQSSHNFWICVLGVNVELMFGKRDISTSGKLASIHRCLVKKKF